jgi:aminoglycoside phosphotransferase (APT) family kinase protein
MSAPDGDAAPEWLDPPAFKAWFQANVPGSVPPLAFERIAGGRSNLTYRVTDAASGAWILRRPPLGERLGSAHDMGREHRILSGLTGTDVAVPTPVAFCADPEVADAEFYVMEFVDGVVLRDHAAVEAAFPEAASRRGLSEAVVDTLVQLHAVDPDASGLGTLGRRDGYAERQLRRWSRQWEASRTRDLPAMDETHRLLSARVPEQRDVSIIHGDYRLDNVIVTPAGQVAAVVDWELCTLGDPLADLGLLLVYWVQPGDEIVPLPGAPTLAPGFLDRRSLANLYAERPGRDVSELDFFVALGQWKLAAILEGVHARNAAGAYGATDGGFESFARTVEQLAEAALTTAQRLG